MYPSRHSSRITFGVLFAAAALMAAGCHSNNSNSGYGIEWVTVTDDPSDFTSYTTSLASLTMTRNDGAIFTAIATEEIVDFTTLGKSSELWASATIPNGTYTSATLTFDYTSAVVTVLNNGVPEQATLVDPTGAALTTIAVTVVFDPANPLVILPTYASTSAMRLAIDFNLAASNSVSFATSPATVTVKPFVTMGVAPADYKPLRVRGPLINSSTQLGTYTVYVRPFHDEASALGSVTMFNNGSTIYTLDGTTYLGSPGLNLLSQAPAGTTMVLSYTTFQPTATAGLFNNTYAVAGSSLETQSTVNLSGDVIQRSGNVMTLRGSTLSTPDGTSTYRTTDALLLVGPGTLVTADGVVTAAPLTANSIAVGQHVEAVGVYELTNGVTTVDATSSNSIAGRVRLESTELYGQLLGTTATGLSLNLQTINNWPVSNYTFAGNGMTTAQDSSAADYQVNTASAAIPAGVAAGNPLWIDGFTNAFGAAPPDFDATTVTAEASEPASLRVSWANGGTTTPFTGLTSSGFSINLANANLATAAIRIGPESISLASLAASPSVVPTSAGVTLTFSPRYAIGNAANGISVFSSFASYLAQLNTTFAAGTPAMQLEARGLYNRATNTFTANSVNVVL